MPLLGLSNHPEYFNICLSIWSYYGLVEAVGPFFAISHYQHVLSLEFYLFLFVSFFLFIKSLRKQM